MELGPGTLVTPNVRLVRLLGRGGMGSVWVADHLGLESEVAVKFMTAELAALDPTLVQRFKREARAAAKLASPHVVRVFDFGVMEDRTPYLVMELLRGSSLRAELDSAGTIGLHRTGLIVAQTAKALAAAHELGIVHRDIKPDNLFLTDSSYEVFVKVLDFGIAKQTEKRAAGAMTSTGVVMGTPDYMSPEQLLSTKDADPQADLWALTVVAYECLVGQLPFHADTVAALGIVLDRAEFVPPSEARPALPAALDPWFRRGLARRAADRFGSAQELAREFVRIVQRHAPVAGGAADGPSSELPFDELSDGLGTVATAPTISSAGLLPSAGHESGASRARDASAVGESGPQPATGDAATQAAADRATSEPAAAEPAPATATEPSRTATPAAAPGQARAASTFVGVESRRMPTLARSRRRSAALAGFVALVGAAGLWLALRPSPPSADPPSASTAQLEAPAEPSAAGPAPVESSAPAPSSSAPDPDRAAPAAPSATALAASSPTDARVAASARAATPKSSAGPAGPQPPTAAPPTAAKGRPPKPDFCKSSPYEYDEKGIWHIKPACL